MKPFAHVTAQSTAHACALLRGYGDRGKLNAGGTDLLSLLKGESESRYPDILIDITSLSGLDQIRETGTHLSIGALSTLADLSGAFLLNQKYPVLARAAFSVATPQIRNVATLGGNLCQEVRCWYYRYPRSIGGPISCLRKGKGPCLAIKGDNRYHAILDAKKCVAVCPSDMAVALTALDATLVIEGTKGVRSLTVPEFYHSLGNRLAIDEMIREVEIPARSHAGRQVFSKFTLRRPIDFAVVSVAAVLTTERDVCTDARIVLGAVGPAPFRAEAAESTLIGRPLTQSIARRASEAGLSEASALSKNGYKIEIAKALIQRAILGDGA